MSESQQYVGVSALFWVVFSTIKREYRGLSGKPTPDLINATLYRNQREAETAAQFMDNRLAWRALRVRAIISQPELVNPGFYDGDTDVRKEVEAFIRGLESVKGTLDTLFAPKPVPPAPPAPPEKAVRRRR